MSVSAGIVQTRTVPDRAADPLAPEPHSVAGEYPPPFTETSHCQEYVAVPVVGIVLATVSGWPRPMVVALGEGVGGSLRAEFTVTVADAEEVWVSDPAPELSLTWSSKV